jgi:hypothetical protein
MLKAINLLIATLNMLLRLLLYASCSPLHTFHNRRNHHHTAPM